MLSLARRLDPKLAGLAAVSAVAALAIAFASGCGGNDDGLPAPVLTSQVNIVNNAATLGPLAFSPNPDTVSVGTTVTWRNNDSMTHTVTSDDGNFASSGSISPGATYAVKFSTVGSYPYHCAIAGHVMTGRIVVQ